MMRTTAATILLLGLVAAPASAELKYTMHLEAKKPATAAPPANPMFAMIGDMMLKMIAPGGSIDSVVLVGEKGTRIEQNKETMIAPAGAIQIMRPDGITIIDPKTKTYWKYPSSSLDAGAAMAQLNPTVTTKRTGEFSTVAGLRAERITFEVTMSLAMPDMAMNLSMNGELWIAPQYKAYAALSARSNPTMSMFSELSKLSQEGLPVRQIMRGDIFGGLELEMVMTKVGEEPAPPDAFDVPAGYKEVPAPPVIR